MSSVIEAARADLLRDDDLAELATVLANSGARLARCEHSADVASTGGIGSLTTLLCPLLLRSQGFTVPKIGVVGRPAGGVDVLQTIPGFEARLDGDAAREALQQHGYVHLLAHDRWAPLDARFFAYRQQNDAQALPPLVIASLLAKKLASGAVGAGLEIRVAPHGNFGGDFASAAANGLRYTAVARMLGLLPTCILTDASQPHQPYIGRGEALLALDEVLEGRARGWLGDHLELCQHIANAVAAAVDVRGDVVQARELASAHASLLEAHGTGWDNFKGRVSTLREAPRLHIVADREGTVSYDLVRLRRVLVQRQRDQPVGRTGVPPDPAGVLLSHPGGTAVDSGETLLSIRAPVGEWALVREMSACVHVDANTRDVGPTWTRFEIV